MLRVTIFNEFYGERHDPVIKDMYPKGIHGALAAAIEDEFSVRTVTPDDAECGLTDDVLADTDVLVWWGHVRHDDVPDAVADRVVRAVLDGMGAIFLHSAHHSKPFKRLMGTSCNLSWRDDGDSELIWNINPSHPICRGIGRFIRLEHEETYGEPFAVPEPDELVMIASYEGGEVFRAGCCYKRENGRIFYFQPGHETFPTFYNEEIIKVIKNAVWWAAPIYRKSIDCPMIEPAHFKI